MSKGRGVRGVTLIELIVVIVIVGILVTIALPGYQGIMQREEFRRAEVNLQAIRSAERFFFFRDGSNSYTADWDALDDYLDMAGISTSNANARANGHRFYYLFTGGTPPTGAEARSLSDIWERRINFDSGAITEP
ncbi:MAG: prepilin-type N-terminal cleavage/methylation domain-containing protein [Candidatus Omnitrophica bacterium]|nr:prepilin-type N-terminal cleavage/methylation domain-containing protein [Candidatus Omnitrophota bacterium]